MPSALPTPFPTTFPTAMRTAVLGAGGMGGYFGGLLARAGKPVVFIARGRHLRALQQDGLTVHSAQAGSFRCPVEATDDPARVEPVDLLLVCVKTYDLAGAVASARRLIRADTLILPVQNGVTAAREIAQICGRGRLLAGVSYVGAHVESPGVIRQGAVSGELLIGPLAEVDGPAARAVAGYLHGAGIPARFEAEILTALWEKFVLVCATGGVLALLRQPMGGVLAHPEGARLLRGVMAEVQAVAQARGVRLADDTAQRQFTFATENFAPNGYSSMALDLLAGRPLELEALNGTAVRMGRAADVPTPLNLAVYAALLPFAQGSPRA